MRDGKRRDSFSKTASCPRLRALGARANSEAGPKGERQDGASQAGIHFDLRFLVTENKMDFPLSRQ